MHQISYLAKGGELDLKQVLQKVGKAAVTAMADSTIQGVTNLQLVELNRRKKAKSTRTKGNYGAAKFLNQDVLDNRVQYQSENKLNKVIASFMRLGPDRLAPKLRPTPRKNRVLGPDKPATVTPIRSPLLHSATAIPHKTPVSKATPSKPPPKTPVPKATPSKPRPAKRPQKQIVKLPYRVNTAVLDQGLQGRMGQKKLIVKLPIRVTTAELGQRQQRQKQGVHVTSVTQLRRSMRTRRPRKQYD